MSNNLVTKIREFFSNPQNLSSTALTFGRSVLLTSVVITGMVGGARYLGLLEGLELSAYDQLMRSRSDEGLDPRLLVVGVSETDIQTRKEYPIEDGTLAELLTKLQENQPRAIGIDIIRDVPQGKAQGRVALQKILKDSENIIAVCKLSSANEPGIAAAPGIPEERIGFADLPLDPGGKLRRALLLSTPTPPKTPPPDEHLCNYPDPENQIPSFGFQLALLYLGAEAIEPELTPDGQLKLASTVFKRLESNSGSYRNADTGNYQLLLNYRSAKKAVRQVSLSDVLGGKVDPAWVKDQVVLIGYTAPIVKDDFFTPYSEGAQDDQTMPGVVIHAQNVSQILSAVLNNRPLMGYWSEGSEILWIFGWSLLGGILGWRIRKLWIYALALGASVAILYGACTLLFAGSTWVPLVSPMLALVITSVGVIIITRGYATTLVQNVKKLIFPVQVEQEKVAEQVKQITESDTFADLERRREELRNRRKTRRGKAFVDSEETEETPIEPEAELSDINIEKPVDPEVQAPETPATTTPEEDDYLTNLQNRGKTLRPRDAEPTPTPESSEDDDYFQNLKKRGKNLRKTDD